MGRPLDTAERGIRFIAFMGQLLEERLAVHPQLPGFKEVSVNTVCFISYNSHSASHHQKHCEPYNLLHPLPQAWVFSACVSLIAHILATATHELSDAELQEGTFTGPFFGKGQPPALQARPNSSGASSGALPKQGSVIAADPSSCAAAGGGFEMACPILR